VGLSSCPASGAETFGSSEADEVSRSFLISQKGIPLSASPRNNTELVLNMDKRDGESENPEPFGSTLPVTKLKAERRRTTIILAMGGLTTNLMTLICENETGKWREVRIAQVKGYLKSLLALVGEME
jgi:hypothetical protein